MEPHCYLKRFLKIEISFIREIAKPVNGQDETAHVHAPPLTVPSGFADGQSRRESLKWLPAHFNYEKETLQNQKRAAKHLRDWSPCSPIQRNGGWRSRPGVSPFISALTVARCPVTFPGEEPLLRDTLSTSRSVGRGTGAFIYAQSAVETRPVLTALYTYIYSLFSCRSKCPCPPRRQRHFHGNADRAYNTLHFASQSRVPNGGVAPFGNPHKKRRYATPPRGAYRLFLLSSPPAVSVEQKSAWD